MRAFYLAGTLALSFYSLVQSPAGDYEALVSKNVMVPMRDGVRLATDIYRPAHNGVAADGKFPVILERTPYNKDTFGFHADHVPEGYIGTGRSLMVRATAARKRCAIPEPSRSSNRPPFT